MTISNVSGLNPALKAKMEETFDNIKYEGENSLEKVFHKILTKCFSLFPMKLGKLDLSNKKTEERVAGELVDLFRKCNTQDPSLTGAKFIRNLAEVFTDEKCYFDGDKYGGYEASTFGKLMMGVIKRAENELNSARCMVLNDELEKLDSIVSDIEIKSRDDIEVFEEYVKQLRNIDTAIKQLVEINADNIKKYGNIEGNTYYEMKEMAEKSDNTLTLNEIHLEQARKEI